MVIMAMKLRMCLASTQSKLLLMEKVESWMAKTSHNGFNRKRNCAKLKNASELLHECYFIKIISIGPCQGHSFGMHDRKSATVLWNQNHSKRNLTA